ncbi:MAG: glycosyltransferase [Halioglobus sp.]|nr:glycosyltransferase [Halioglobus sp.]
MEPTEDDRMRALITAIMPVYNGVEFIEKSLPPLVEMCQRGEIHEVIVVDDGSTDGTALAAERLGARVIQSGGRLGPGGARNRAAQTATGAIYYGLSMPTWWCMRTPRLPCTRALRTIKSSRVFGSYDDNPPAKNFFSQYKNLVHHYYHQRAREEAQTFWSGCGAVRRDAFLSVGGFDVERYKYPSIEDIELGHRLIDRGGRVRLRRDVQCTHLKVWRLRQSCAYGNIPARDSMVPTDSDKQWHAGRSQYGTHGTDSRAARRCPSWSHCFWLCSGLCPGGGRSSRSALCPAGQLGDHTAVLSPPRCAGSPVERCFFTRFITSTAPARFCFVVLEQALIEAASGQGIQCLSEIAVVCRGICKS